jgi:hypothetical protein
MVPAIKPSSSDGNMRAAKISPMAKAPLPASSASHAVAVRSIPCAAAEATVDEQRIRNARDAKGVTRLPYLVNRMAPHHIVPNSSAFSSIWCGSAYRTVVASEFVQGAATCEEIVALPNGAA